MSFLSSTDRAPIPDLSKIVGEPNAPAETTINLLALIVTSLLSAACSLETYSTPTARPFLLVISID